LQQQVEAALNAAAAEEASATAAAAALTEPLLMPQNQSSIGSTPLTEAELVKGCTLIVNRCRQSQRPEMDKLRQWFELVKDQVLHSAPHHSPFSSHFFFRSCFL
jgi:hypothetical protein